MLEKYGKKLPKLLSQISIVSGTNFAPYEVDIRNAVFCISFISNNICLWPTIKSFKFYTVSLWGLRHFRFHDNTQISLLREIFVKNTRQKLWNKSRNKIFLPFPVLFFCTFTFCFNSVSIVIKKLFNILVKNSRCSYFHPFCFLTFQ